MLGSEKAICEGIDTMDATTRLRPLWIGPLACLAIVGLALGETVRYRGNAYHPKTGAFLYSENHEEHYEDGRHAYSIVSYRDPKEKEVCRKRITFRKSRSAPDFRLDDRRTGYMEASTAWADGLRLSTRKRTGKRLESRTVKVPAPAVVDGGFDYFIRDNWTDLVTRRRTLPLNFVSAVRLKYVGFTVRYVGTKTVGGIRRGEFKLAVAGWVASLLVDPIYIAYDLKRRRLMEYRGLSNVDDARGRSQTARIVFSYPWTQPGAQRRVAGRGD